MNTNSRMLLSMAFLLTLITGSLSLEEGSGSLSNEEGSGSLSLEKVGSLTQILDTETKYPKLLMEASATDK